MNKEYWKDIPEFEGLYEISTLGNIKRVQRYVKNRNGYRLLKEKIIKLKTDKDGYKTVILYRDGEQYTFEEVIRILKGLELERLTQIEMTMKNLERYYKFIREDQEKVIEESFKRMRKQFNLEE